LARRAKHKLLNEAIQKSLKLFGIVSAIDNISVILFVALDLGTEFTTKKFGRICGRKEENAD
jgi:hypothetical protein